MRDPIWQMLGVFIAVIAIFVTASQTTFSRKALTVVHDRQSKLADQWLPGDRFKLLVQGTTYDIDRTVVDYYMLINESRQAIRPTDFVTPLEIRPNSGIKRILSVESCSKPHAQVCSADGSSTPTGGAYAPTSWKQNGDAWAADNPLLNEGDRACVLVVSELAEAGKTDVVTAPSWSARITDYHLKVYDSPQAYVDSQEKRLIDYVWTVVVLQGPGVYWFLLLLTVTLFVNLSIAGISNWLAVNTKMGVLKCVLIALLCTSTSEILVDIFVNRRSNLHAVVWPLLVAHGLFVTYLARRALTRRQALSANGALSK